jgi:hypothetical protein
LPPSPNTDCDASASAQERARSAEWERIVSGQVEVASEKPSGSDAVVGGRVTREQAQVQLRAALLKRESLTLWEDAVENGDV